MRVGRQALYSPLSCNSVLELLRPQKYGSHTYKTVIERILSMAGDYGKHGYGHHSYFYILL